MHSKRPVYALLVLGALVVAVLTAYPYTLTRVKQAGQQLAERVKQSLGTTHTSSLGPEALPPPPSAPVYDVAVWYGARGEAPEGHGVFVRSFDGRRVYASLNADTTFNPASLLKLATTLVALRRFGPDHRFVTRVFAEGGVDPKQKRLDGSLYLDGQDPSFGDFAANVVRRELKARGIERVRDKILATPGFSFNYSEKPDDSAKRTADAMKLGQKETGAAEQAAGSELFKVHSNPLREVLLYMNAHSNNFVADHICEQFGGPAELQRFLVTELKLPAEQVYLETCSGLEVNRMTPRGIAAVIRALADEVNRHGLKIEDVMPVASCDWGTLRKRLEGTAYQCAAVGKTGTLTDTDGGMSNLAGIAFTEDAGPFIYVILTQGRRISEQKQSTDALLTELLAQHRPAPLGAPGQTRRQLMPSANLRAEPQLYTGASDANGQDKAAAGEEEKESDDIEDEPEGRKAGRKAESKTARGKNQKAEAAKGKAAQTKNARGRTEPTRKTSPRRRR
ncbi:MAG TPA: D-alanyl-D-alanine carboxypeptidase [Pyrinomonadaceae bacterium]|nr:D-alanyl-D-alanine carboxypeptidase [Pyrinomonadaceae bacterium]